MNTLDNNTESVQALLKEGYAIKRQIEKLTAELDRIKFRVISQAVLQKKDDCNTVNLTDGKMTAKVSFKTTLSLKKEAQKASPEILSQFCRHSWQVDKRAYDSLIEACDESVTKLVEVKHAKPSVSFDTVEDVALIGFVE